MKPFNLLAAFFLLILFSNTAHSQVVIPDYKNLAAAPGANYFQIVAEVQAKLQLKKQELAARGIDQKNSQALREELAQFGRWSLEWRDKIGIDGSFPNPLTGWINAIQQNPELFDRNDDPQVSNRTTTIPWTSIGPVNNGVLNGWTFGGGIGRINVVKRHPGLLGTLFAGSATGGLFKSVDLGTTWTPMTDQFAGLGVSDLVILPNNSNHMVMATGDFDGSGGLNSIGIFKTTDGGSTWTNKLPLTLNLNRKIAHIYIDPDYGVNNTLWATGTFDIYRSTDQGETWASVFNTGGNENFNDIIKVGTVYFASGLWGSFFRSPDGTTWTQVYTHAGGAASRIDFTYSPNTPDIIYILTRNNPAFARYTISTNTMGPFSNITNNTLDPNADFNTQGSYNQVIAANPANGNDIMVGEFSGKRTIDGGTNWTAHLNGYYTTTGNSNWGNGYVHSDIHHIDYIGSAPDSLMIGNDGAVYLGPVSNTPFSYKECVDGLVCIQSYSISIFDTEPNNLMIGNQDNDGRSRNYAGAVATWYAAQAGDGISTAIHRTNKDIRFLTGTTGSLSYRSDAFVGGFSGKDIGKPNDGVFAAPLEMHLTNGNILYGGYADVYKSTGITPSGDPNIPDNANWVNLTSGLGDKPIFIGLSNHPGDPLKQRIVAIGDNNVIRKTTDEISWSTITPPAGVLYNSIYWSRNSDTMIATARGYTAANKIFFSADAGNTWTNITDNMPNIQMVNTIRKEGSDTVFVATELGVFFARLNPAGGVLRNEAVAIGWTKFGTGLPNVKVTDMEISYTKKQLFISSWGRGVWMVNLFTATLAASRISFTYKTYNSFYHSLSWKIEAGDIMQTVLEKSYDGITFSLVGSFTDAARENQPSYLVQKENRLVYYRLYYVTPSGNKVYSQIIFINSNDKIFTISVYPNPASDYVNVVSTQRMDIVKITSLSGQQLTYARPQSNSYSFDMSLLPAGTYIVQVWDIEGNIKTEKIIRE